MEIIIENVLLDNFTINALLLFFSNKFINTPISRLGIVIASLFGAGFSLISPLIILPSFFLIIVKILLGFVIVWLAQFSFYKIFQRFVWFLVLTFVFGGAMFAIFYFLSINVSVGAGIVYYSEIPLGFLLSILVGMTLLLFTQIQRYLFAKKYACFSVKIELCVRNKKRIMKGFLDTGNNLITKYNKPVVIISESDLRYWFSDSERLDIILGKYRNLNVKNLQELQVQSITKGDKIVTFDADYLRMNNRIFDVAVGVNVRSKRVSKNFDVLLNNKLIEV